MGITYVTYVEGVVSGEDNQSETLQFLVDSGTNYTLLPHATWNNLGLKPFRTMEFLLADGTVVERQISACRMSLDAGEQHTPVILGEPGDDQALLGVVTLEEMGLVFDPFKRELRRMVARM